MDATERLLGDADGLMPLRVRIAEYMAGELGERRPEMQLPPMDCHQRHSRELLHQLAHGVVTARHNSLERELGSLRPWLAHGGRAVGDVRRALTAMGGDVQVPSSRPKE